MYPNVQSSTIYNSQDMESTYTSINRWMDKEDVVHIYNVILLSHLKEWIWVSSSEVNEPRVCYTEENKSKREKQIQYINTHIWNLEKWSWWTYLQEKYGDTNVKNELVDSGGGKEWDEMKICINIDVKRLLEKLKFWLFVQFIILHDFLI